MPTGPVSCIGGTKYPHCIVLYSGCSFLGDPLKHYGSDIGCEITVRCVVGSSLEWRHESRESRLFVRASTTRPSKPRQLVRLPFNPAGPALHALRATHRPRGAQVALHGQQLHDRRRLVLTMPYAPITTADVQLTTNCTTLTSMHSRLFADFWVWLQTFVMSSSISDLQQQCRRWLIHDSLMCAEFSFTVRLSRSFDLLWHWSESSLQFSRFIIFKIFVAYKLKQTILVFCASHT